MDCSVISTQTHVVHLWMESNISAIGNLYQNSFQNTKESSESSSDHNKVLKVTISFVKNILFEETRKWFLIII